jgi:Fe-S oxidoreductase
MPMLQGRVQPALSPNTHAAAVRLLERLGIGIVDAAQAGCCGASPLTAHARCSMQGKPRGAVESSVQRLGFDLTHAPDGPLCCGSARTYSITRPQLARSMRHDRLDALESGKPESIVTANIGCQTQLESAGRRPVRHWIERVEASLP